MAEKKVIEIEIQDNSKTLNTAFSHPTECGRDLIYGDSSFIHQSFLLGLIEMSNYSKA